MKAKLMRTIHNPHGFDRTICTLEGNIEYLTAKLDAMPADQVNHFHIE